MSRRKLKAITIVYRRFTNSPATSALCAGGCINHQEGVEMSLEKYLKEALRLLQHSQHYVSICQYKKHYHPTEEDIALLQQLHHAYNAASSYTKRITHIAHLKTHSHKEK